MARKFLHHEANKSKTKRKKLNLTKENKTWLRFLMETMKCKIAGVGGVLALAQSGVYRVVTHIQI